jgi:DNA-binding transcriptional regulator YhcF (GntR family)
MYGASMSGTKLAVRVDPLSPVPLHEQVAATLRRRSRTARPDPASGSRRPVILPRCWGVNANTVLRVLRDLRDEGIVEFRRGCGVTVAGPGPSAA